MRVRARETSAGRQDALVRSEKTRRPPSGGRRRDVCSRRKRQSTQKDRNDVCARNCGPSIRLEREVQGGTEPGIYGWGDKQGRWWRAGSCHRVGTSPPPPSPPPRQGLAAKQAREWRGQLPVQEVGWCRGAGASRAAATGTRPRWCVPLESHVQCLVTSHTRLPCDPAFPLLCIHPNKRKPVSPQRLALEPS